MDMPTSIDQIDAPWLNAALEAEGRDAVARSVALEPIGGLSGITGQLGRLRVDWERGDVPETLIVKAPNTDEISKMYNATMRFYARESGFYADIAAQLDLAIPEVYVNTHDVAADFNILILQDLAPAIPGDCVVGTDFDTAQKLMDILARLHGRFWMDRSLANMDWLWVWNKSDFVASAAGLAAQGWEQFTAAEPDFFSADLEALVKRRYIDDIEGWVRAIDARPYTFCHGDFELDNFLFENETAWVVDWQMCLRTCPGVDVAWLIASSLHGLEDREQELLDGYRATLAASGGPQWSHEDLMEDLAWGLMFWVAGQPLLVSSDTSVYGEHGPRMAERFRTFLEGTRDAAIRWDFVERLS